MLILIPVDKKGQKSEIHLTIKTSNNGIYLQQISLTIRFVVPTVIKRYGIVHAYSNVYLNFFQY